LKAFDFHGDSALTVVMGNEACDLDSGVSAICLAFHLHQQSHNQLVLPLLNIPEEDFPLKTELVYCLEKVGIKQENLIFTNLIDLSKIAKLSLVLVDHNILTNQNPCLEQAVIEVLDHHVLERPDNENTKIVVERVGSCATLVAEKIFQENPQFDNSDVLTLLLQTILLDTVLLSESAKKVTAKDITFAHKIEAILGQVNREEMYNSVQAAKDKIDHLSVYQLLKRDLKSVNENKIKICLSAIPRLVHQLCTEESTWEHLSTFCTDQGCDAALLLGYSINQGSITRDMLVYSKISNQSLFTVLTDGLQSADNGLQLTRSSIPVDVEANIQYYKQGNGAASRKVILPAVKDIVKRM